MNRRFLSQIADWQPINEILSIIGATGTGKTQLALQLFQKFPEAVLVSVDATAAYAELDIGSAKPLDNKNIWTGLDLFQISQKQTVKDFIEAVCPAILEAHKKKRPIVLVGGSHFYENAMVEGMAPGSASDSDYQEKLLQTDLETLYQRLLSNDSRWAEKIHNNDRYRISRALDLVERQNLNFDQLQNQRQSVLPMKVATWVVDWGEKAQHTELLSARIEKMFELGWVDETRNLIEKYGAQSPGLQSIGYSQMVNFLTQGQSDLSLLKAEILQAHLGLVKKQKTWVRGLRQKVNSLRKC